jgi:hypothetical protein
MIIAKLLQPFLINRAGRYLRVPAVVGGFAAHVSSWAAASGHVSGLLRW